MSGIKKPTLLLKWGTVKGWRDFKDGECKDLLKKYMEDAPFSCMMDRPEEARKHILCELINKFDGTIWNDWNDEEMTKEQAIKYVMEYGK